MVRWELEVGQKSRFSHFEKNYSNQLSKFNEVFYLLKFHVTAQKYKFKISNNVEFISHFLISVVSIDYFDYFGKNCFVYMPILTVLTAKLQMAAKSRQISWNLAGETRFRGGPLIYGSVSIPSIFFPDILYVLKMLINVTCTYEIYISINFISQRWEECKVDRL